MNNETIKLDSVLADCVARMQHAARDRRSAMHTPVIATADGEMRIVVLRACDEDLAMLRFHTDARSPKIATIRSNPAIKLLAYDPQDKVQIRAGGTARVESAGPLADAAWAEASAFARRCYLIKDGPGTAAPHPLSGLPAELEGIGPTEDQLLPGRANFAVVQIVLDRLDWLHLAHDGHRRAQFRRGSANQSWQGTWIVP